MIKYFLDNNLFDEFYVKNYTNASLIVNQNIVSMMAFSLVTILRKELMMPQPGLWRRTKTEFPKRYDPAESSVRLPAS